MSSCDCNAAATDRLHTTWCSAYQRGDAFHFDGKGGRYQDTIRSCLCASEWNGPAILDMAYGDWLNLQFALFPTARVVPGDDGTRWLDLSDWTGPQTNGLYARVGKVEGGKGTLRAKDDDRLMATIVW